MSHMSPQQPHHASNSDVVEPGSVLRKVASLTISERGERPVPVDMQRVPKPKAVPHKLDFQLYEKFEGKPKRLTIKCGEYY
jgi:hypothetical protein